MSIEAGNFFVLSINFGNEFFFSFVDLGHILLKFDMILPSFGEKA